MTSSCFFFDLSFDTLRGQHYPQLTDLTPTEKIMQFWASRAGVKKPKDEREALLLHKSIKSGHGCWDCPNRLQCEWAERTMQLIAENRSLIQQEKQSLIAQKEEKLLPPPKEKN